MGRGVILNVQYSTDLTSEWRNGRFSLVYRFKMAPSPDVYSAVSKSFFYKRNETRCYFASRKVRIVASDQRDVNNSHYC